MEAGEEGEKNIERKKEKAAAKVASWLFVRLAVWLACSLTVAATAMTAKAVAARLWLQRLWLQRLWLQQLWLQQLWLHRLWLQRLWLLGCLYVWLFGWFAA
jgi:hypothetical protein